MVLLGLIRLYCWFDILFIYVYFIDVILNLNPKIFCYILFLNVHHFYRISQPILIGELLEYFNPDNLKNSDIRYAYLYASGLVISLFITTIIYYLTDQEILNEAMKTRVACSSLIYRKVNL